MGEHYKTYGAVMLFLLREVNGKTHILLQKRANTGYADGMWDCGTSGHVEDNESMKCAMIREAKEELGIKIENLHFATFVHKHSANGVNYYNNYFVCNEYEGIPEIMEKNKCSEIQWFPIEQLPKELLDDRKEALSKYLNGISYSEHGW